MTAISDAAQAFRHRAEDESAFLETCDGGDPGSPVRPSTWVFGIEPGWSLADAAADAEAAPDQSAQLNTYSIELQLGWPYNRGVFKLLAALEGRSPDDYRAFAESAQPFVLGSTGYLKGNLFPEPFHNVGEWDAIAVEATGFETKAEYQTWMRESRFAVIRRWIERSKPKLLIGTGTTFAADFLSVADAQEQPETLHFEVNGHAKRMLVSTAGIVPLAIVPHLSGGPHGLNSDAAIKRAAELILERVSL